MISTARLKSGLVCSSAAARAIGPALHRRPRSPAGTLWSSHNPCRSASRPPASRRCQPCSVGAAASANGPPGSGDRSDRLARPAMTESSKARSRTRSWPSAQALRRRVLNPGLRASGTLPGHPRSGPTTPQKAAGPRSEPPWSVPSARANIPVASPTAEPPSSRRWSGSGSGVRCRAEDGVTSVHPEADSGALVFPTMIPPSALIRLDDQRVLGWHVVGVERRAEVVRSPAVRVKSLIPSVSPWSGPSAALPPVAALSDDQPAHWPDPRRRDQGVQRWIERLVLGAVGFEQLDRRQLTAARSDPRPRWPTGTRSQTNDITRHPLP